MGNENEEYLKGAMIEPFFKSYEVDLGNGNKGPLLVRKDSVSVLGEVSPAITTALFFSSGLIHGATMSVRSKEEQDKAFDEFTQEDANAIARHSFKETCMYLKQVQDGVEDVNVQPKEFTAEEQKLQSKKENFKEKIKTAIRKIE